MMMPEFVIKQNDNETKWIKRAAAKNVIQNEDLTKQQKTKHWNLWIYLHAKWICAASKQAKRKMFLL